MVAGALAYLRRDEERINGLNVFPVPDGDTGTNMILTVAAALENAKLGGTLSEVAESMAIGALRGARGNSGTIVSQFFHGFYLGVRGLDEADPFQIAAALESAASCAYAAVLEPKEGTILTVGRRGAEAAVDAASRGSALIDVIQAALAEAALALEETREVLDVLRMAGVVDAGGEGLVVGVKGAVAVLKGEALPSIPEEQAEAFAPESHATFESDDPHHRMAIQLTDITYQYCTEFLVEGQELPLDEMKRRLEPLGDSLMVVGSDQLVKVHVHTNRPGQALEIACDYGDLISVSVGNMKQQNREHAEGASQSASRSGSQSAAPGALHRAAQGASRSAEPSAVHRAGQSGSQSATQHLPQAGSQSMESDGAAYAGAAFGEAVPAAGEMTAAAGRVGVVSVCSGKGFEEILRRNGVAALVHGGQSMNPSAGELAQAIASVGADEVIVLPNNKNITLTANQAAKISGKKVIVVPTDNLPQAVAATFDYDPDRPVEEVAEAMSQAIERVRVAEVTHAVRDASINGMQISKGDWLGIVSGELVAVEKELSALLMAVIEALAPEDGELITLYSGSDVSPDECEEHLQLIQRRWPSVDVEAYDGGQPVYLYLIAVE